MPPLLYIFAKNLRYLLLCRRRRFTFQRSGSSLILSLVLTMNIVNIGFRISSAGGDAKVLFRSCNRRCVYSVTLALFLRSILFFHRITGCSSVQSFFVIFVGRWAFTILHDNYSTNQNFKYIFSLRSNPTPITPTDNIRSTCKQQAYFFIANSNISDKTNDNQAINFL